ncbi:MULTISPECIES: alpha/beta family hydrolase [Burkholderia]|uniref:Dienelactone hydrolase family protein n=3 Tax=Burkholderia humptydooensis TaxID=430531 RepID=A0A7U4P639_9BURK|nr:MULTISPECIES: alpha/beta family hydrolase [Burkholderia]AGK47743.1 dienelactone hydrolase [Burkholderia thailandensis MSMB121]AJY43131.1 dienelactone hydrolase [Burkholderia sp. 2002721687]ALX43649.1 hydrolase [Burkholderia humptydooensis]KST75345.1 hydrolase [Burkholderia humptydooensis]KVN13688.1 hydrolase [Burkholderia sp. MSMB1552]
MQIQEVRIPIGKVELNGMLAMPEHASGIVVFAHGSGSSRLSPRNQEVAAVLQRAGLATLLFDLLTIEEQRRDAVTAEYRFAIAFLARRLVSALDWLRERPDVGKLPVGLFGASTGAAAALIAANARGRVVRAVVSRGGRPDLAGDALPRVRVPTLLIVGERDDEVLRLNRVAAGWLIGESKLVVVPGATHLFEEPGTLDEVARVAAEWFVVHLGDGRRPAAGARR